MDSGDFSQPHSDTGEQLKLAQQQQQQMADTNGTPSSHISMRRQSFTPELIEEYLRRNKHRVFNCRKCKLYFPSSEYFSRHLAYHNELETYKFPCEKCPERFQTDQGLQTHQLQHADQSPHFCLNCSGVFRSALALRRHRDNWPQCHSPPFASHFPYFLNPPIDEFSFVESDLDELANGQSESEEAEPEVAIQLGIRTGQVGFGRTAMLTRKTTRDSGYQGSDTLSPAGSQSPDCDVSSSHSQEHSCCSELKGQEVQQKELAIPGNGAQKGKAKRKRNAAELTMIGCGKEQKRSAGGNRGTAADAPDQNNNSNNRPPF